METGGATTYGTLDSAPDGRSIERIYNYVALRLQEWATFGHMLSEADEDALTDEFSRILNQTRPAKFPFCFQHQPKEKALGKASTDLAAYKNAHNVVSALSTDMKTALVKFEAKRLTIGLGTAREREYVVGQYDGEEQKKNSGAIERFKNGRHGKDVSHAGIIAYVQSDTFDVWLGRINGWIQDEMATPHDSRLTWDESDKLQAVSTTAKVNSYHSSSSRLDNVPIAFRHLWVNLCPD